MILSTRYARPLLALLLLAAVPVWVHVLREKGPDDCARPEALFEVSGIPASRLARERGHGHGVIQRTEGLSEPTPGAGDIQFRLFRSYARLALVLDPSASLPGSYELAMQPSELRWIDAGGEPFPVYLQRVNTLADTRVAAYFYVFRSRPVSHPFRAQLASAVPALFGGAPPLTLFSVTSMGSSQNVEPREAELLGWVRGAWRWYRSVCGG